MIDPNLGFDPVEDSSYSAPAWVSGLSRSHLMQPPIISDIQYYRDALFMSNGDFDSVKIPDTIEAPVAEIIRKAVRRDLDFDPLKINQ